MNKQQLVVAVADKKHIKIAKGQVEEVINTAFDAIKTAVKKGDDVRLVGFGTFTKAKRKARVGRNPQTGAQLKIPATNFPKFKAGSDFKSLVR